MDFKKRIKIFMRKLLSLSMLSMGAFVFAQEVASVEKALTGVQIGLFGVDLYHETKLADEISLRGQVSLNPGIWGGDMYSNTGFALTPSLSLGPKYYYNLKKRSADGKNISNNSANYFSVQVDYFPNWFVISSVKGLEVNDAIYFTPNYGIRRNFAKNFNYEFRAGIGIGKIFKGDYSVQARPDLSLKVGYDF